MAEEIRGLTVKFDTDFSDFKKGMKDADKDINSTTKQLKSLQDSLKLKFDTAKFEQSQRLIQQAIEGSEKKAELLKQRLLELEKAGVTDKTRDEYNYLQEQLVKTETQVDKLKKQLEDLDKIKLQNLQKGFKEIGDSATQLGNSLKGVSTAAAGVLAGLTAIGIKTVASGDEISTLASKYDMTAEALQKWQYVAMQSDVENSILYKSFQKLNIALGDQLVGNTSKATQALEKLGISYDQFDDADKAFEAVIAKLSSMNSVTEQVAYATDIFGDRFATELVPMLQQGTNAIKSYIKEFEELSYMSNESVEALSKFDNVMNNIKAQFEYLRDQLGIALLPLMEKFADTINKKIIPAIQKFADWFSNLSIGEKESLLGITAFVAALAPLLLVIGKISTGISSIIGLVGKLGATATATMGWIGAIIALLTILYTKNEKFRESVNKLVQNLMRALQPAINAISKLLNRIMPVLDIIIQLIGNSLAKAIDRTLPLINMLGKVFEALEKILEPVANFIDDIVSGLIDIVKFVGEKFGFSFDNSDYPNSGYRESGGSTTFDSGTDISNYKTTNDVDNSSVTNNNNVYNVEINIEAEKGVDIESLTDEIARMFVTKVQSYS